MVNKILPIGHVYVQIYLYNAFISIIYIIDISTQKYRQSLLGRS